MAYTPEAKSILLNLPAEDIPPGAVGEKLTVAMAAQAKSLLGTDLALAVTGALGPASPPKTSGWPNFYQHNRLGQEEVRQINFAGDRQTIKEAAVNAGIDFLLAYIARWSMPDSAGVLKIILVGYWGRGPGIAPVLRT